LLLVGGGEGLARGPPASARAATLEGASAVLERSHRAAGGLPREPPPRAAPLRYALLCLSAPRSSLRAALSARQRGPPREKSAAFFRSRPGGPPRALQAASRPFSGAVWGAGDPPLLAPPRARVRSLLAAPRGAALLLPPPRRRRHVPCDRPPARAAAPAAPRAAAQRGGRPVDGAPPELGERKRNC
jgi:hypothetical protein